MRTQPKVSETPRALPAAGRRERDLILPWGCWAAVMWKRASVASRGTSASLHWAVLAMGMGTWGFASSRSPLPGMEKPGKEAGLHHGYLENLIPSAVPPVFTVDLSSPSAGASGGNGLSSSESCWGCRTRAVQAAVGQCCWTVKLREPRCFTLTFEE